LNSPTIFLLSPAHCGGRRTATLARPEAAFDLAVRVREDGGAPLGEVFSFLSGLYFRGKMAYAKAFSRPPPGVPPTLIISCGRGLLSPETRVRLADLSEFAEVDVNGANGRYTAPLLSDLRALAGGLPEGTRVVLLGSIATTKYVEVMLSVLGDRLHFPEEFIGKGDMSRGAMMLRAAESGDELRYVVAAGALRSNAGRVRPALG
jgi:hypothetical protein